jgi:hypothetical protein
VEQKAHGSHAKGVAFLTAPPHAEESLLVSVGGRTVLLWRLVAAAGKGTANQRPHARLASFGKDGDLHSRLVRS